MSLVPAVPLSQIDRRLGQMVREGGINDVEIEYDDGVRIGNFDEPVAAVRYEIDQKPCQLELVIYRHGLEFDDPDAHSIPLRQLLEDWLMDDEAQFAMAAADDLERIAAEVREWAKGL